MKGALSEQKTALLNRMLFNETADKALIQAKRHHKILALLFINIDHFQKIKETHDKRTVQLLLDELSQRFNTALRASDTLAHLENDEFAILLTDLEQPKRVAPVAEKLLQASLPPFKINAEAITLTTSIGIGIFPEDGQTLEELQQRAIDALDQAKHQEGNNYQFRAPQRTLEARDFIKLQAALHQALQNNEFILHYQPQLDLKTRSLTSVEALIRWQHPRFGLIDPLQFIPSAEETSLIIPIGEWALREACRTNKQWQDQGYQAITVAVNLSPKQFYQPQLIHTVTKLLQETALEPRYLELEITEMTVMHDTPSVNQLLRDLKNLGLSLAIDDFGTGHTSIRYLRDFPINTIKIDQSFIKSLPDDAKNAAITEAIITLAHQFDIKVVAEGVETMQQLQFLEKCHCDQAQGYLISPPLPAAKLVAKLVKH